jgi:peptide/nickel transport system permease protein
VGGATGLLGLLGRRLLVAGPTLMGILVVVFLLVRLSGESPVPLLAGPNATAEEMRMVTAQLGLDRSLPEQLWIYLGRVAQGDLGRSWLSGRPVLEELRERLPATLELVVTSILLGGAAGILLGQTAAFRPGSWVDRAIETAALVTFSVPIYVLGLVAILVFFALLQVAPPPLGRLDLAVLPPPELTGSYLLDGLLAGDAEVARSAAAQLALPAICFAFIVAGPVTVQTRAVLRSVLASDFIAYARAAGLPGRDIRRMARRNGAVPIVTLLGAELAHLFAGSALIELIFAWGGLGHWGLNAILQGDFAVVQGYVLVLALFSTLVFLAVDVIVFLFEPRSRAG